MREAPTPEQLARESAEHPRSKFAPHSRKLPSGLTVRQRQVLLCIRIAIVSKGYPPTLRDIGRELGIKSTNGVSDHLRALVRKGYLTTATKLSRGITLTEAGRAA